MHARPVQPCTLSFLIGRHIKSEGEEVSFVSPLLLVQEEREPTPQEKQEHAAKKYKKLKKGDLEKASKAAVLDEIFRDGTQDSLFPSKGPLVFRRTACLV